MHYLPRAPGVGLPCVPGAAGAALESAVSGTTGLHNKGVSVFRAAASQPSLLPHSKGEAEGDGGGMEGAHEGCLPLTLLTPETLPSTGAWDGYTRGR